MIQPFGTSGAPPFHVQPADRTVIMIGESAGSSEVEPGDLMCGERLRRLFASAEIGVTEIAGRSPVRVMPRHNDRGLKIKPGRPRCYASPANSALPLTPDRHFQLQ